MRVPTHRNLVNEGKRCVSSPITALQIIHQTRIYCSFIFMGKCFTCVRVYRPLFWKIEEITENDFIRIIARYVDILEEEAEFDYFKIE